MNKTSITIYQYNPYWSCLLKESSAGSVTFGEAASNRKQKVQGKGEWRSRVSEKWDRHKLVDKDLYGSNRCETIWKACTLYINRFNLLPARRNSLILIHFQCPAEIQTTRWVKSVNDIFNLVNKPNSQGNESNKLTIRKQTKIGSSCSLLPRKIYFISC